MPYDRYVTFNKLVPVHAPYHTPATYLFPCSTRAFLCPKKKFLPSSGFLLTFRRSGKFVVAKNSHRHCNAASMALWMIVIYLLCAETFISYAFQRASPRKCYSTESGQRHAHRTEPGSVQDSIMPNELQLAQNRCPLLPFFSAFRWLGTEKR
ncbi:hypothetical protein ARMGADRAFT_130892 [Armillaria gallica]|uniref:Transmembrane protein n=1 Tax=Armillaria gallica TaxID=47427 RepID=A0A2H3DEI1_ARMGA|nr:hypothetical protein ARMGADRAFT_130892 [Armillaria gallica]